MSTGRPLTLSYGLHTERTTGPGGVIASVSVPLPQNPPENVRLYLMVGTYPAATASLRLQ